MSDANPPSARSTVRRLPQRADYDPAAIAAVLDAGLVAHVGIVDDGLPVVIPMVYSRRGDTIYLHGAPASRLLKALANGAEACITVTLVDGLVLARSAFHHSVNYRSAVVFGTGREVTDAAEKTDALLRVMERMLPGRWAEVREPNDQELRGTLVVAVAIREASAKVRVGPPKDDADDHALPIWAGVLPLQLTTSLPVPDALLRPGIPLPAHLADRREPAPFTCVPVPSTTTG